MQYSLTADYVANSQSFVRLQSGAGAGKHSSSPFSLCLKSVLLKGDTLQCFGSVTPSTQPDRTTLPLLITSRHCRSYNVWTIISFAEGRVAGGGHLRRLGYKQTFRSDHSTLLSSSASKSFSLCRCWAGKKKDTVKDGLLFCSLCFGIAE